MRDLNCPRNTCCQEREEATSSAQVPIAWRLLARSLAETWRSQAGLVVLGGHEFRKPVPPVLFQCSGSGRLSNDASNSQCSTVLPPAWPYGSCGAPMQCAELTQRPVPGFRRSFIAEQELLLLAPLRHPLKLFLRARVVQGSSKPCHRPDVDNSANTASRVSKGRPT